MSEEPLTIEEMNELCGSVSDDHRLNRRASLVPVATMQRIIAELFAWRELSAEGPKIILKVNEEAVKADKERKLKILREISGMRDDEAKEAVRTGKVQGWVYTEWMQLLGIGPGDLW